MAITNINKSIIDNLVRNANFSTMYRKHSAAIIKNKKIINYGVNSIRNRFSHHAEINAIRTFLYKQRIKISNDEIMNLSTNTEINKIKLSLMQKLLKSISLVILRLNDENEIKESKPCYCCCNFLKNMNMKNVTYSTDEGIFVVEKICNIENDNISNSFKIFKNVINNELHTKTQQNWFTDTEARHKKIGFEIKQNGLKIC